MRRDYTNRVWQRKELKGGKLLVMLALAEHADAAGECWPGMPLLMEKTRLTDRQIRRVLNTLHAEGTISIEERAIGRGKRPHYKLFPHEKADILSDQNEQKADISDNKSGHLQHEKADISDENYSHARREPTTEPTTEPGERRAYAPSPANFGVPERPKRFEKQFVDGIAEQYRELGLSPPEFTSLVDAILDGMGKSAVAALSTKQGRTELTQAQECALALVAQGKKTPTEIKGLFATFKAYDWRGKKGELPDYESLVDHIAELPSLIAASRENVNGYHNGSTPTDYQRPETSQHSMAEHKAHSDKRKADGVPF